MKKSLQEALPSSEEDENNIQNVRADHRRQHEASPCLSGKHAVGWQEMLDLCMCVQNLLPEIASAGQLIITGIQDGSAIDGAAFQQRQSSSHELPTTVGRSNAISLCDNHVLCLYS